MVQHCLTFLCPSFMSKHNQIHFITQSLIIFACYVYIELYILKNGTTLFCFHIGCVHHSCQGILFMYLCIDFTEPWLSSLLIITDRSSHESMLCTFSPDVKTIAHVVQYKIRRWRGRGSRRGTSVARAIRSSNVSVRILRVRVQFINI